MENYVMTSLESHLFFGRIMKEHALFLLAGFPAGEDQYQKRANFFRQQFEDALSETVRLANTSVGEPVLHSGEIVTGFTEIAERQTQHLTKIPINIRITQAEKRLQAGRPGGRCQESAQQVRTLNRRILQLLNAFISFKENILQRVTSCRLYTSNYPLLIEHILREAKLYRQIIAELEQKGRIISGDLKSATIFWNQIMMEHAQFIRGLLDPTEHELFMAADGYAGDFCLLLEEARKQDLRTTEELTAKTVETTEKYRDFKAAGTEGLISCKIRSVILPLLADHVLREANHYLRILKTSDNGESCISI